ncbi:hypothetical protein [Rhodococcus sp. C3V]|uniref:hypothetical protein n=1 Tax=Rhodococcus sp. C3V TaxID=3034165 RepID=UPI0023E2FF60|nr:hypothetical protein [Rhodococcus sp. C3V]MDF3319791.1 hypothetical protein [Rhodococcus sp. C3V]
MPEHEQTNEPERTTRREKLRTLTQHMRGAIKGLLTVYIVDCLTDASIEQLIQTITNQQ